LDLQEHQTMIRLETSLGDQAGEALNQGLRFARSHQVPAASCQPNRQAVEEATVLLYQEVDDNSIRNLVGWHIAVLKSRCLQTAMNEDISPRIIGGKTRLGRISRARSSRWRRAKTRCWQ
jgi:hypothetical protein